jgi:hypothetical protein
MPVKKSLLRPGLLLTLVLLASGCASGARPGAMTVSVSPEAIIAESSPIRRAIEIGAVTGGSETNPLWKSNVSNDSFRAALEQSLALHTMVAATGGRYLINADLVSLDQPFAGFELTVTAKVHYTVLSLADQAVRLDQVVETPYTAHFSDAFVAVERLRLANEGAMRANINAIIKRLVEAAQPGQPLSL